MSINRLPNISALIYGLLALTSAIPMLCLSGGGSGRSATSRDSNFHPPRHSWLLAAEHHHHLLQQQKSSSNSANDRNQDLQQEPSNLYSVPFESVRLDKHEKSSSTTTGKKKPTPAGSKPDSSDDIFDDNGIDEYEKSLSPQIITNTSNSVAGQRELAAVIKVKPIMKSIYFSQEPSNREVDFSMRNNSAIIAATSINKSTIKPRSTNNQTHFTLIGSAGALNGRPEVVALNAESVDVSESSRVEHNSKCALILKRTYILRKKHTDEWGDKFVFNDIDTDDKKK